MLSVDEMIRGLRTFRPAPDSKQKEALDAAAKDPLFIVAGPGTGKTTCLTLRILALVLVYGIPPRGVLATTFTVKAAEELRSRVLGWGFKLIDVLASDARLSQARKDFVRNVDINQVWTGTVDSLCEQLLRDHRAPGTQPPVLVDDYVSKTLMLREGLFGQRRDQDPALDTFLLGLYSHNNNRYGYHVGSKAAIVQSLWERRFQDLVDWQAFVGSKPRNERAARQQVAAAHDAYEQALSSRGMVDFSLLENEVLRRLKNGQLNEFTKDLKVVLVDEYQDSNLLQEQIYFELASACGGALTVVGDDDQSLYRFRGATVDLFSEFAKRYRQRFQKTLQPIFLTNNYRSTDQIRGFVSDYAVLDRGYRKVRVASKPELSRPTPNPGLPVLGMFRDTINDLARDLARFIHQVFRGRGVNVAGGKMIRDSNGGDVGDCALLCSSPAEFSAGNKLRLPLLLRQELAALNPVVPVFNPRGEDLAGIDLVQRFGGLLLECLDPGGVIEGQTSGLSQDTVQTFQQWRNQAITLAADPAAPKGLRDYAVGWADRKPGRSGLVWPRSVSAIDLIYGLVHFFPEMHDDPEGQVYLEVFTRQLGACEQVGKFSGRVVTDPTDQGLSDASVKELLRDFLGPIASGLVQVNEELLETFPRDRLSVLSIHQSKGLEFPLTIVDVGSDYKTNHQGHSFKRFPVSGGPAHRLEDLLRPHSPLGASTRTQIDRAFDDLYRQFFVAFSRPQDVLLLVGLNATAPGGRVSNVATGWTRDGNGAWEPPNRPFEMI